MSLDQDKVAEVVNKTYAAYVAARDLGDEHLMELTEAVWKAATTRRREEPFDYRAEYRAFVRRHDGPPRRRRGVQS